MTILVDFYGGQRGVDIYVSALARYLWARRDGGGIRNGRVGSLWALVFSEEERTFSTGSLPSLCAEFRANGLGNGGCCGAYGAQSKVGVYRGIVVVAVLVRVRVSLEQGHLLVYRGCYVRPWIPSASTEGPGRKEKGR